MSLTVEELEEGDGEEGKSQAASAEKKEQNNLVSLLECCRLWGRVRLYNLRMK